MNDDTIVQMMRWRELTNQEALVIANWILDRYGEGHESLILMELSEMWPPARQAVIDAMAVIGAVRGVNR